MPQVIDITSAYGMKRFYKEQPRRLGLFATLVVTNLAWMGLLAIVVSAFVGTVEFANLMSSSYIRERWEHAQMKKLTAQELAERDMRIARLIAYQNSSPTDVVALGRKISMVLDSAPSRHRGFMEQALPEAMMIQVTHKIPASAVLAMAIYESGYGKSTLATQHHNYFGIKAFNTWAGPRAVNMPTRDSGVATRADFRAYPSLKQGFQGYAEFLKETGRYREAFKKDSGIEFVRTILAAGYCPDHNYLANIQKIMERHHLAELDRILEHTTENTTLAQTGVPAQVANTP
jgi:flagellum-specific peptidoglycan hydrolase FlgJ